MLFTQWQRTGAAYRFLIRPLSAPFTEGLVLFLTRLALAGVFWRSGRTKVEAETLITIKDSAYTLFEYEYTGLPLAAELATPLAVYAEHVFPILLVLGLATRFSATALLIMTLTIQIFVYPDAWWTVHSLWAAMALMLMVRGGGWVSMDAALVHWSDKVTRTHLATSAPPGSTTRQRTQAE